MASLVRCTRLCLDTSNCKSLFYDRESRRCQLHSAPTYKIVDCVDEIGWRFYTKYPGIDPIDTTSPTTPSETIPVPSETTRVPSYVEDTASSICCPPRQMKNEDSISIGLATYTASSICCPPRQMKMRLMIIGLAT
ncbi:Hypothetical predicted protein, partial [Mytilus galloprovincialis]